MNNEQVKMDNQVDIQWNPNKSAAETDARLQDLVRPAAFLEGEDLVWHPDAANMYVDGQAALADDSQPLHVKPISVEEYARFAASQDILPLAGPGLYHRMMSKGEDARIYGGYLNGELQAAMICRIVPAWKLFRWIEAPFGPVMKNPLDSSMLVRLIQGIEEREDTDTLLYLRLESFLEYQAHQKDGSIDYDGPNNKAWRKELRGCRVQPLSLNTGFEPGRQARFAGVIDLAKDSGLYRGIPFPSSCMQSLASIPMKRRRELYDAMSPAMQEKIMQAQQPYIRVRLLARNELDLIDSLQPYASEPLDLSYLEAYENESAMVLVSLDTDEYVRVMKEGYEHVSNELQAAFRDARNHPHSTRRQKALFQAMTKMKVWDQELVRIEQLEKSRQAEIPLAAGLYLFNPGETLCLWTASSPSYTHLPGLEAMHWFMLDWSRSRHALRYTIWGLSGNIKPGQEGYEAFAFARDLGARLAEYSGAFMAAFKPGSTKAYQAYLKSRNLQ